MVTAKQEWSKAYLIRPRDNIISHDLRKKPSIFKPSYDLEDCPTPISWLLGGEYGRIWLRERDQFVQDRAEKSKPKFIKNDYMTWVEKRKIKGNKGKKE